MLYKINDNVIYRREMDNVLMLSPKTKKLFIFKKDVAESIDYNKMKNIYKGENKDENSSINTMLQ